jgi:hypothetical protein
MKMLAIVLLAALGGCATADQPYSPYAYHQARVVYVDGYSYVDHGVYNGPPPPDTIIPQDDPEVGPMTAPARTEIEGTP